MGPVTDLTFGPWNSTQALYYLTFEGRVGRIAYTGNRSPVAVAARHADARGPRRSRSIFNGSDEPRPGRRQRCATSGRSATAAPRARRPTSRHTYTQARHVSGDAARDRPRGRDGHGHGANRRRQHRPGAVDRVPRRRRCASASARRSRCAARRPTRRTARSRRRRSSGRSCSTTTRTPTRSWVRRRGNDISFQAPPPEDLTAAGNSYLEVRLEGDRLEGLDPDDQPGACARTPSGCCSTASRTACR